MARTARDLITDALRTTGAIGAIETPEAEEIAHGLNELNNLVAQLDLDTLYPYVEVRTEGTITSGKKLYSIGTGADIDITRPNDLITFSIKYGGIYMPLTKETPRAFDNESKIISYGSIPSTFIYRTDFPNGTLEVYPEPQQPFDFIMTSNFKNLDFGLNDEILLPSGYYPLLQYNLAKLLLIHYPNPEKYALVAETAMEMLARVKRLNNKAGKLKNDFGGNGRGRGDIYSDTNLR
jgi:hypothetical protein